MSAASDGRTARGQKPLGHRRLCGMKIENRAPTREPPRWIIHVVVEVSQTWKAGDRR
ncbi:hypothetical protein FA13DRAFT_1731801 [Coprinellus micaceus]|uniref:Uncharacterized protein n=1 Tax=Coprinellus micaceus TaxID=71717 RepID=A0A4Y7TCZ7_COPMI|nr:hypothetical protein FA13DRAFT_1731801 [Coprinellus micaceus]